MVFYYVYFITFPASTAVQKHILHIEHSSGSWCMVYNTLSFVSVGVLEFCVS